MMENRVLYGDKDKLVQFIMSEFKRYTGNKISPIKLQKTLYFLFAHYGGFVKASQSKRQEGYSEFNIDKNLPVFLFEPAFQAWSYGPVDYEVYKKNDDNKYSDESSENLFEAINDVQVRTFLQETMEKIFNTSDFGLVNLSHLDEAWISQYDENDLWHNNKIDPELLIEEYESKY